MANVLATFAQLERRRMGQRSGEELSAEATVEAAIDATYARPSKE